MCEDIQYLATLESVKTYFGQGAYNTQGAEFAMLRTWVASRLLWNPNQDYKELVNEFVEGYYGPASVYIKQYIRLLYQSQINTNDRISSKQRITTDYLSLNLILQADSLMKKADSIAGERYSKQVHKVRIGVDMTILLREQLYKAEAKNKEIVWNYDSERRNRFMEYSKEAGITDYNEGASISSLYSAMDIMRKNPSKPDVIKEEDEWIDFQDLDFSICCGANIVQDNKASDNGAVKYSGKEWAVQVKLDMLPSEGSWVLYASVRCEVNPNDNKNESAFSMGVDPGTGISPKVSEISDGEYHIFEFPEMPLSYQTGRVLWFYTHKETTQIFIDRIIARKVK